MFSPPFFTSVPDPCTPRQGISNLSNSWLATSKSPGPHRTLAVMDRVEIRDGKALHMCVFILSFLLSCKADNTVREAKNQYLMTYLNLLTAKFLLKSCTLCHLRKSHTHCRIGLGVQTVKNHQPPRFIP